MKIDVEIEATVLEVGEGWATFVAPLLKIPLRNVEQARALGRMLYRPVRIRVSVEVPDE